MPETSAATREPLDVPGAVLVTTALAALSYAAIEHGNDLAPVAAVAGAAAFIGFLLVEHFGAHPMLPLTTLPLAPVQRHQPDDIRRVLRTRWRHVPRRAAPPDLDGLFGVGSRVGARSVHDHHGGVLESSRWAQPADRSATSADGRPPRGRRRHPAPQRTRTRRFVSDGRAPRCRDVRSRDGDHRRTADSSGARQRERSTGRCGVGRQQRRCPLRRSHRRRCLAGARRDRRRRADRAKASPTATSPPCGSPRSRLRAGASLRSSRSGAPRSCCRRPIPIRRMHAATHGSSEQTKVVNRCPRSDRNPTGSSDHGPSRQWSMRR